MRNCNGRRALAAAEPKSHEAIQCAIYTRKSTDEGLQQDFYSLDAQREAGQAYIASQRHEGWRLVAEQFDDGGFTLGNWLKNRKPRFSRMNMLVAGRFIEFTAELEDVMRIYTDSAAFDADLNKAAAPG